MRHCVAHRRNRKPGLMDGLVSGLIKSPRKQIRSTVARLKDLRPVIEKLITLAKTGQNLTTMRLLASRLKSWDLAKILAENIAPKLQERNGGYTRIIKIGEPRKGDNSKIGIIQILDQDSGAI